MRLLTALGLTWLLLATAASAQDAPDPTALLAQAQAGNAAAQRDYADLYYFGQGVPQDTDTAMTWYRKAADQNDDVALFMMGQIYEQNPQLPYYLGRTIYWYNRAAQQNYVPAQYYLGRYLLTVSGITYNYPDAEEGLTWLGRAAEADDVLSQLALANIYGYDDNSFYLRPPVPRDDVKAVFWYRRAATIGDPKAMSALALRARDGLGMTADPAEAVQWARKVVEGTFPDGVETSDLRDAQTLLGIALLKGSGVPRDEAAALNLLTSAAEDGDPEAAWHLGEIYRLGLGVKKDKDLADQWQTKARGNDYDPEAKPTPAQRPVTSLQDAWQQMDAATRALAQQRSAEIRKTSAGEPYPKPE